MDSGVTFVPLAHAADEGTFGGKAVSLGAAIRAGLPVPAGAALSSDAVDRIARAHPPTLAELFE